MHVDCETQAAEAAGRPPHFRCSPRWGGCQVPSGAAQVRTRRRQEGTAAAHPQRCEGWPSAALAHLAVAGRCWTETGAAGGREERHLSRKRHGSAQDTVSAIAWYPEDGCAAYRICSFRFSFLGACNTGHFSPPSILRRSISHASIHNVLFPTGCLLDFSFTFQN